MTRPTPRHMARTFGWTAAVIVGGLGLIAGLVTALVINAIGEGR